VILLNRKSNSNNMKSVEAKAVEAAKIFEYSHQLETANP
jgi:hypothetical protein